MSQKLQSDKATFCFGRMQPPHTGHVKLINATKENARLEGGDHHVFLSHTHDPQNNPLSFEQKVGFLRKMLPGTNVHDEDNIKTPIDIMKHLEKQGYKKVTMMVGSDRHQVFHNLLHKYNGTEYHFPQLEVKSAGDRDPDSRDVEGVSSSKMRDLAKKKDFANFSKSVLHKAHASELYRNLRKGMKLENYKRQLKALFLVGGPGSGKDFLISHTILNGSKLVELSLEKLNKAILEGRNIPELDGNPSLIVNGNADILDKVSVSKAVLENLGYDTSMIYVYTENDVSMHRNNRRIASGIKTFDEGTRKRKYNQSVMNMHNFNEMFNTFFLFDNSCDYRVLSEEKQDEFNGWIEELNVGIAIFFEDKTILGFKQQKLPDPKPAGSGEHHKSILPGYERVRQGKFWVLRPKKTEVKEDINSMFENYSSTAADNSRGSIRSGASNSPTENDATIIKKVQKKGPLKGDSQGGIASSAKNMSEPPVVEEKQKEEPSKEKSQKFRKVNRTKGASPPPNFFDGRMGSVPSGGVGLSSSFVPKGRLFSELRKTIGSTVRNIDEE